MAESEVKNIEIFIGSTNNNNNVYRKGQKINFINVLDDAISSTSGKPQKTNYDVSSISFSTLLNYEASDVADTVINNYQGLMPVYVSPYQTVDLFKKEVRTEIGVKYNYTRFTDDDRATWDLEDAKDYSIRVQSLYYISPTTNQYTLIQNFINGTSIRSGESGIFTEYYPILYTREEKIGEVVTRTLTPLQLVKSGISQYSFRDYNVTTDRKYQYVFYPLSDGDRLVREDDIVSVKWDSWSITELHPLDKKHKNYYAGNDDIWVFNLNVETGEQTQNISRNENITLGTYPRYSQGRQNRVSGQVTCLMGTDVVPLTYLEYGTGISFSPCVRNGYQEIRFFDAHPTSNEKVDMLKKWRQLVFSKNPKLLKDRKGQSFIVTITNSSNKPFDNVRNQPDTISFSWSEIQSLDDVTITDIK